MLRVFWTLRSRCPRGLTGAELTSDLGAVGAQPSCTRSRLRAGLPGGRGGGYAHGEAGRAGAQLRATGGRGGGGGGTTRRTRAAVKTGPAGGAGGVGPSDAAVAL